VLARAGAAAAVMAAAVLFSAPTAFGDDPPAGCDPTSGDCETNPTTPGKPGGGGDNKPDKPGKPGGGGPKECKLASGEVVPCHDPRLGWFDRITDCYHKPLEPQPPKSDPIWEGHTDGAIYETTCLGGAGGTNGGVGWRATPPPGFGGPTITPGELAQQMLERMKLQPPAVGIAPGPGKTGVLGMPVWIWNNSSGDDKHWGTHTLGPTCVGAVCVTLTARATKTVWSMGDGNSVTCTTAGTPWKPGNGNAASPDCGYPTAGGGKGYTRAGTYQVVGTTTWVAHWEGAGQAGDITLTLASAPVGIRIAEVQVLTSSPGLEPGDSLG
jgi:hypothetical protein